MNLRCPKLAGTFLFLFFVLAAGLFCSAALAANTPQADQEKSALLLEKIRAQRGKPTKVSADLLELNKKFDAHMKLNGVATDFKPEDNKFRIANDLVLIEAIAVSNANALKQDLSALGGVGLESVNFLVSGYVPIAAIPAIEALDSLRAMTLSYPMTNAGLVTSQGDFATRASTARANYGVNGSGVTIGTMSDSFNCLGGWVANVANNDLPAGITGQEISSCVGATDEGRAMMQIIHDLAPGTTQMFHTASEGMAAFANGIHALANAGADIIVDDIIYFSEPFFQDGPIAQAVNEVSVQDGVIYFSAAGNYGTQSYESVFRPDVTNNRYHDFNPAAGEDVFQSISLPVGATLRISLQWSERYASVSGPPGASTNFDFYLTDQPFTQFLAVSLNANIGADPIEFLVYTNPGPATVFNLVIDRFAGTGTPVLKYVFTGGMLVNEYQTNSSTIFGHPNALWAEAIGSVNYWETPAYGVNPPLKAPASSVGGTPILFDTAGNAISPSFRSKPNFSCVHGVNTTFFGLDAEPDGWPNFFGTSAAAPHAAALAALIKQYRPTMTPFQVLTALENTAVNMDVPGFDYLTGTGLCNVNAALGSLPGFTVSAISGNTTEAGGTATFTVVLNSQPTANVTIGLSSSDTTEGTVSPNSLVFTSANWNSAQQVTVTGVNDNLDDGDVMYTIVTAAATSSDGNYTGLNAADVSVTNIDNDTAGITVSAISGNTTEAGGTATFTVVLNSQPTANVTIGLSSNDTTEGTVLPMSLVFTNANWNTAQLVTVTGVNDNLDDGDVMYSIVTAAATSSDVKYNGMNPANVSATNIDNDTAGITVSAISGNTNEAGGTATFTVVLNTQPSANVTIGLSSNDTSEGTVLPTSLVFTNANWNSAQLVTVTGVNDNLDDGDVMYNIVTAPATSSDVGYSGLNAADVSVTNTDNDTAGITVSVISGNTTESGGIATFTVVLNTQPTSNVTIGLSSNDMTEGTVLPVSLVFTDANWSSVQLVTVTGVNDDAVDGDVAYSIITAAATSSDVNYAGLNAADVSVTNIDNDTAGITVSPISGITTEAGGTATFTVVLNTQPSADVTIGLSSNNTSEGTVLPTSLVFTNATWNSAQIVTVTGINDDVDDGDVAYSIITAPATSSDGSYSGLNAADVSVINIDDDGGPDPVIFADGFE